MPAAIGNRVRLPVPLLTDPFTRLPRPAG
jgi:hypothetical protein